MWLVYAGIKVNRVKRRGPIQPLTPGEVSVDEAVVCATWEDAWAAQSDMASRHFRVAMLNLGDPKAAASIIHCGMVLG